MRGRGRGPVKKEPEHRINDRIIAPMVRVVGEGMEPTIMNTRDAIKMAYDEGLDLVEISPNANPNVNDFKCTILGEKGAIHINPSSHDLIQVYTDEKVTVPDIIVSNRVFDRVKGFSYESIRDFIDRLIDGKPFRVSMEDAAEVTRVVLAIMESAETRMPVEIKYE